MRCMSCLEICPRREIRLCHGCKAWYCRECFEDHRPCNRISDLKSEEQSDDSNEEGQTLADDSKPGVWIIQQPESNKQAFDFWSYVA